ncbi:hypothetical protein P279_27825 [Rhodobacteraceae bacterium PD-2]|nr:hypothetical protein P279_27825 [Rhodobacteraceae bacterium PD-2]
MRIRATNTSRRRSSPKAGLSWSACCNRLPEHRPESPQDPGHPPPGGFFGPSSTSGAPAGRGAEPLPPSAGYRRSILHCQVPAPHPALASRGLRRRRGHAPERAAVGPTPGTVGTRAPAPAAAGPAPGRGRFDPRGPERGGPRDRSSDGQFCPGIPCPGHPCACSRRRHSYALQQDRPRGAAMS